MPPNRPLNYEPEGDSDVTLDKAREISELAAKVARDTQFMLDAGSTLFGGSMRVHLQIKELAALAETFRPVPDYGHSKKAATLASVDVPQPVAGVKRRRADSNADANNADNDGPAHPKPFAGREELGPNFPIAVYKGRAQQLPKYEPGLAANGKFNFEVLLNDYDTDHKNAKYYVRMVEMDVGEKTRLEWIEQRLEWMVKEGKEFLGGIEECLVKKLVVAGDRNGRKRVRVEEVA